MVLWVVIGFYMPGMSKYMRILTTLTLWVIPETTQWMIPTYTTKKNILVKEAPILRANLFIIIYLCVIRSVQVIRWEIIRYMIWKRNCSGLSHRKRKLMSIFLLQIIPCSWKIQPWTNMEWVIFDYKTTEVQYGAYWTCRMYFLFILTVWVQVFKNL